MYKNIYENIYEREIVAPRFVETLRNYDVKISKFRRNYGDDDFEKVSRNCDAMIRVSRQIIVQNRLNHGVVILQTQ